jgi:hypothetical protein
MASNQNFHIWEKKKEGGGVLRPTWSTVTSGNRTLNFDKLPEGKLEEKRGEMKRGWECGGSKKHILI